MGILARLLHLGAVSSGSGNIGSVYFRYLARSEQIAPSGRMLLIGGGAYFGEHRIQRFICDSDRNYFGYDLLFDPAETPGSYRIAFEPLSLQPDQLLPVRLGFEKPGPEPLPLEQLPAPQMLRSGHALQFPLATADGKYNVTERIEFSELE